jgi:hypothetical protein
MRWISSRRSIDLMPFFGARTRQISFLIVIPENGATPNHALGQNCDFFPFDLSRSRTFLRL